ncbi:hypothetical protein [Acidiphilium acidophilum]|uniref:Uncharacterized protein n=1 Tax=Acidiphilium acidophilum TaxID=76588 RepID=A0AAW9DTT8_ACIAO|nr:hypothetical protein [Acidiphilium acidophilum]MDX5931580.1 hypothetical protein [Acidiphilium acidophilum]
MTKPITKQKRTAAPYELNMDVVPPFDPGKRVGRAPALTPQRATILFDYLRRGHSRNSACAAAGISVSVFGKWIRDSREPDADEWKIAFAAEVAAADGKAEENILGVILDDISAGGVESAKWWLERRRREDYGVKTHLINETVEAKPDPAFQAKIERAKDAASIQREIVLMLNREPDKAKWPPDLRAAYERMVNPKSLTIEGG